MEAVLSLDLRERGVDCGREARIVELHREILAAGLLGDLLPRRAEIGIMWSVGP